MDLSSTSLEQWRRQAQERLGVASFIATSAMLVLMLPRELWGSEPARALYAVPGWLLISAGTFIRGLPMLTRRALILIGLLCAIAMGAMASGFQLPNAFVASAMTALLGALFLPRVLAWSLWGLTVVMNVAVAYLFCRGISLPPGDFLSVQRPENWVRVLALYGAMSAAVTIGLVQLRVRLEAERLASEGLVRALRAESTQRLTALAEQRALESQLRESQEREALGALAGSVAHDFNNLLMVVINGGYELAAKAEDPALRRAAENVHQSGRRAAELTRDLLTFSRKREGEPSAVDVGRSAEAAVRLLKRVLPSSIAIEVDLGPNLGNVVSPPGGVEQILLNLCVNARDAMPRGGTIRIRGEARRAASPASGREADYICVSVSDQGEGMTAETAARAFEPLFTTKDPSRHPGLGLVVVQRLLEQVEGFAQLRSAPAEGTVVEVYWPAEACSSSSAPHA